MPAGKDKGYLTVGEELLATGGGMEGLRDPKDGSWHGTGTFEPWTMKYFSFYFKGQDGSKGDSAYIVNDLLLEHLRNNEPSLTCLDLEGRNLKDAEMLPVIAALKGNTVVTSLKLARNQFDNAALDLAEILKENTKITHVDLRNNDIHEKSVQGIAEMLGCNDTIRYLDLTCCFVRKEAKWIADALGMNSTLNTLLLDNCQIENEEMEIIITAVEASKTCTTFSAYNNCCTDKKIRQRVRAFKPKK